MWDGVYRLIRKTTRRENDMLLRNAAGETLSPEQSAELLATSFYPDDSTDTDNERQQEIRELNKDNSPEHPNHSSERRSLKWFSTI